MEQPILTHFAIIAEDGPIRSRGQQADELVKAFGVDLKPKRLRFACNPKATQSRFHQMTPLAMQVVPGKYIVNCPKCLASPEFIAAAAEWEKKNMPTTALQFQGLGCC